MAKKAKRRVLFQRLWSEVDEIVILKRMINYIAEKNADPLADLDAFDLFIDKEVHIDASRAQLQRKIRRMRSKFLNNKKKEKGGKDRTFSKPHEQEAYCLSKLIWNSEGEVLGNSIAKGGALLKKRKALKEFNAAEGNNDAKFVRVLDGKTKMFPNTCGGNVEGRMMKIGEEFFEGEKAVEGGKQWESLKTREIELYIAQLEVKKAQAKLVLDILKS